MKTYTAIYSTKALKNIQYAFQAVDGNMAKMFCHQKFNTTDIIIRDEETGYEFPLIDEWLSDTAYVSRDMCSNIKYTLYVFEKEYNEFLPIIGMTDHRLVERTDDGKFYWMEKSTHKCGKWYAEFPKSDVEGIKYAFLQYCENHGKITFEELS